MNSVEEVETHARGQLSKQRQTRADLEEVGAATLG